MAKRTIVTMPGDGIGKVVLPEAIRVLEAAGFEAEYVNGDIGWDFWCNEGNPLPQSFRLSIREGYNNSDSVGVIAARVEKLHLVVGRRGPAGA